MQWLTEYWLVAPTAFDVFVARVEMALQSIDTSDVKTAWESEDTKKYKVAGSTAVIPIRGPILASVPKFFKWYGIEATSTVDTYRNLQAALGDKDVKDIVLDVDSPGGTISGVVELADLIAKGKRLKPITASVGSLMASAAYWIGSQANSIVATKSSMIGSIGAYMTRIDTSKMYENEGIKVHLISSGKYKGAGTPGVEVTQEVLAADQELIDTVAGLFTQSISEGRKLSIEAVNAVADGRVWLAEDAKKLKLIDAIRSHNVENSMDETKILEAIAAMESKLAARIDNIEAKVATSDAENKILAASLQKTVEAQKEDAILTGIADGRIYAENVELVKSFASKVSLEELKAFVTKLPKITKEAAKAEHPQDDSNKQDTGEDQFLAKTFNISISDINAAASIVSVSSDGMALLTDGTRKPLAEVMQ